VHPPWDVVVASRAYNNVRLNGAIGYITPKDMLAGHQQEIQADRDRKLEAAREQEESPPAGRVTDENGLLPVSRQLGRWQDFGASRFCRMRPN
jgi:hypothetical protein